MSFDDNIKVTGSDAVSNAFAHGCHLPQVAVVEIDEFAEFAEVAAHEDMNRIK